MRPRMAVSRSLETEFSAWVRSPGNANEAIPKVSRRVTRTAEDHSHHWRRAIRRMLDLISSAPAEGGVCRGSVSNGVIKPRGRHPALLAHQTGKAGNRKTAGCC